MNEQNLQLGALFTFSNRFLGQTAVSFFCRLRNELIFMEIDQPVVLLAETREPDFGARKGEKPFVGFIVLLTSKGLVKISKESFMTWFVSAGTG